MTSWVSKSDYGRYSILTVSKKDGLKDIVRIKVGEGSVDIDAEELFGNLCVHFDHDYGDPKEDYLDSGDIY